MSLHQFFSLWKANGDSDRCFYCGIALLSGSNIPEFHPHFKTKDHFIPKSRRKLFVLLPEPLQNMPLVVAACQACNGIKGNRTPEALRTHVRKMNDGKEVFFAEELLGIPLRSLADYLAYCKASAEEWKQERILMTQRSIEAVAARRKAGLLPPVGHKKARRKAMEENVWWNAMNSIGKLVFTLEQHGVHLDVAEDLRATIARIKSTLPEEFARRKLGVEAINEIASQEK